MCVCDQIAERRQKRAAQLSQQQKLEMEEEVIRQQQERDRLNEKLARQVESTTLKDSVKVRVFGFPVLGTDCLLCRLSRKYSLKQRHVRRITL